MDQIDNAIFPLAGNFERISLTEQINFSPDTSAKKNEKRKKKQKRGVEETEIKNNRVGIGIDPVRRYIPRSDGDGEKGGRQRDVL